MFTEVPDELPAHRGASVAAPSSVGPLCPSVTFAYVPFPPDAESVAVVPDVSPSWKYSFGLEDTMTLEYDDVVDMVPLPGAVPVGTVEGVTPDPVPPLHAAMLPARIAAARPRKAKVKVGLLSKRLPHVGLALPDAAIRACYQRGGEATLPCVLR